MKTALYITNGLLQVVLTPDTTEEKRVLDLVEKKDAVEFYRGSFFACNSGYTRFAHEWEGGMLGTRKNDESLIIVLKDRAQEER